MRTSVIRFPTKLRCLSAMAVIAFALQGCAQTVSSGAPLAKTPSAEGLSAKIDPRVSALARRVKSELVFIPGGTFDMGDWGNEQGLSYDGEANSKPLHKVTLDSFSMMAYKVTYDDFDLFTETIGEQKINQTGARFASRAPRKPAGVNWYGAKAYCQWLGTLTSLPFDLATEAQWEYAARSGGKRMLFATDNGNIDKNRNYPWDISGLQTPAIGSYPPNPIGLYGMLDYAASEWVNDWYDPDYYKISPTHNPQGPSEGKPAQPARPEFGPSKVLRGHIAPGNSPAMGGFVFSRGAREPKEVRNPAWVAGYSSSSSHQFRCAVQQATRIP